MKRQRREEHPYIERVRQGVPPEEFKQQFLGQWLPTTEVKDASNRPPDALWKIFSKICYKIEEACARSWDEAEPGDFYLSLHHDKNWYIMKKTEDGAESAFNIRGQRTNDLIETLTYIDCFIYRYNANMAGEDE